MILRESHMPDKEKWESYFSANLILKKFGLDKLRQPVADIACGYGTFTVPLAMHNTDRQVYAIDINTDFLGILKAEAIKNIHIIICKRGIRVFEHTGVSSCLS